MVQLGVSCDHTNFQTFFRLGFNVLLSQEKMSFWAIFVQKSYFRNMKKHNFRTAGPILEIQRVKLVRNDFPIDLYSFQCPPLIYGHLTLKMSIVCPWLDKKCISILISYRWTIVQWFHIFQKSSIFFRNSDVWLESWYPWLV